LARTGNCRRRPGSLVWRLPRLLSVPGPGDPSWWPDWRLPRHRQGVPVRISRNGSTFCIPGNATLRNTTLGAPNLVRELGRNEPQFRSRWGIIEAYAPPHIRRAKLFEKLVFFYCLEAVQRPVQPSARTNEPDPLLADMRPELVQLRSPADPRPVDAPFGLTDPGGRAMSVLPAWIVVFDRCGWRLDTTARSRGAGSARSYKSTVPSRKREGAGKAGCP
jgi:hypothetical protein